MKAARITAYGDWSVFSVDEVPDPVAGPDDVVIDIAACGLNPLDWKVRRGFLKGFLPFEMPWIIGWDVAGTVAACGANVTDLGVGDPVVGYGPLARPGGYAEKIAIPANLLARLPKGLDFTQAAALPIPALTAHQAVHRHGQLAAGQSVLVLGAAGGVGSLAARFAARVEGVSLYGVARSPGDSRLPAGLFTRIVPVAGIDALPALDLVLDFIGGEAAITGAKKLKPGGRIVSAVELGDTLREAAPDADVTRMAVEMDPPVLEAIMADVLAGKLALPVTRTFTLAEIGEAHRLLETEGAKGKFVLTMS